MTFHGKTAILRKRRRRKEIQEKGKRKRKRTTVSKTLTVPLSFPPLSVTLSQSFPHGQSESPLPFHWLPFLISSSYMRRSKAGFVTLGFCRSFSLFLLPREEWGNTQTGLSAGACPFPASGDHNIT